MKKMTGICIACVLGLLSASVATAAPKPRPAPAGNDEPCTASIEDGKKYHWFTHKGGTTLKSGYLKFTSKRYGRWSKVIHLTDQPKQKRTFWGYHEQASLTIKSSGLNQRWTAYKKYCKGSKILGTVFEGGKQIHAFTVDTSRTRD